ncbi:polysaccharide lyase family 7 protein [Flavobacterium sp.]|uniref:polysaccharide lyase family 7 protein n=1 Tax=Flavobacterium sp. TaxID=239 RepID=UPI002D0521B2|nr:polysaccharide lyase family 7 protein [Flavobacterium sp.]HSD07476.1 polysaccharide lyase family 7 protein [Flavobacterium sp.]
MKKISIYLVVVLFTAVSFSSYGQKGPKIDFSQWRLVIPEGAVTSFKGQKLLDYSENLDIQKYMYNDPTDKSLVFFFTPALKPVGKPIMKTELKEQNAFGGDAGWTFRNGAKLKATLKMGDLSRKNNEYPRIIFLQIGGRLKEEQVNLIGAKDKNAPAILKVYWDNGYIKLRSKRPVNPKISGNDLLKDENWIDDDGFTFKNSVGFDKFTIQITISEGKMEVNVDGEKKVYSGINYENWGVFDNYFTIGCNPQTDDTAVRAAVKYYSVELSH